MQTVEEGGECDCLSTNCALYLGPAQNRTFHAEVPLRM